MRTLKSVFILSIALMGCGLNTTDFSKPDSFTTIDNPKIVQPVSPIPEHLLISEQGIGFAKLGTTFKQLKQKLGTKAQFKIIVPFIVDFSAIAVYQAGKVQFYILYPSATTLADSDAIAILLTDNPNYRTAEGVGVGTTLQQAQAIYGQAILSYNTQSESREMVSFANYSPPNIVFMPRRDSDKFAGIYPSSSAEYHETKDFNNSATIGSVFVGR